MKNSLLLILLILPPVQVLAQQENDSGFDTIVIPINTHEMLQDAVVIDDWNNELDVRKSTADDRLELQLKQLQGINLVSRGNYAQEVMYRGQQEPRLQLKLNGMRIYSACTDRMDPSTSYIVSNNLRSAEVASACKAHCSNAGLAGNVNLELKQATFNPDNKWRWGLSQIYHTNTKGTVTNLNLENHQGKLAWRLNGSFQKHNNYYAGGGFEVPYSQNQKVNLALNTAYRVGRKEMLKLDLIYDLATDIGYPALPMDVSEARAVISGVKYSNSNGFWNFGKFDVNVYYNNIYHEMDDSKRENVVIHMDMPGWSNTTGISFDSYGWKTGKHELSLSAEYYTNYRKAEMTMYPTDTDQPPMYMQTWPETRLHGMAAGLTDLWKLGATHITTSIRFDYESSGIIEEFGERQWEGMGYNMDHNRNFFLPKIKTAIDHHLNEYHSINTAISYGFRGASTSELYGFYLFNASDGYDNMGNPDLRPEQLLSMQLGHVYTKDRLHTSIDVFIMEYRDFIFGVNSNYDPMTIGARGVRISQNIPHATYLGFDGKLNYHLTEHWSSFAKLEYLRGITGGINLPYIPPFQGNLATSYGKNTWTLMLQGRYALEQAKYNTDFGDQYTPGYVLADLSANYGFTWGKANLNVEIACRNLFDTYYRNHLNWGGIPDMGRNIMLKVKISD